PLLEQRSHNLQISVPRRGMLIEGDELRLAQVVANLLTNAARYTEPGGRIAVSAWRDDGSMFLRISDTGVGIAPEILPRIFDMFVQGKQSLDRTAGGLGLGLTIVRSIVELHGGTVTAKSEGRGKGSELDVRLPAF